MSCLRTPQSQWRKKSLFAYALAFGAVAMTAAPAAAREQDATDAYSSAPVWAENALAGGSNTTKPYSTKGRDSAGVRLVYNGRVIDLSEEAGTQPSSLASSYSSGVMSGRPTLGGPTLSAASIGNNIEITNAYNSSIFINQYNNASQVATVGGGR